MALCRPARWSREAAIMSSTRILARNHGECRSLHQRLASGDVSQLLGDDFYRISNLVLSVPRSNEESYARRLHGHGRMNDGERIDAAIQQPVCEPHGTDRIADHD